MADSPRKPIVLKDPGTPSSPITRRRLLEAGFAAALALPLLSACPGPGEQDGGPPPDDGGTPDGGDGGNPVGCTPTTCAVDSNTLVLPLSEHPELVPVLGWSIYFNTKYSDPICQNDAILVIQVSKGNYAAFSGSCTHQCCTVELSTDNSGKPDFFCPCHRSTYDLQGNVTAGPATANLPTLPVCFDGCAVYVQLA